MIDSPVLLGANPNQALNESETKQGYPNRNLAVQEGSPPGKTQEVSISSVSEKVSISTAEKNCIFFPTLQFPGKKYQLHVTFPLGQRRQKEINQIIFHGKEK